MPVLLADEFLVYTERNENGTDSMIYHGVSSNKPTKT